MPSLSFALPSAGADSKPGHAHIPAQRPSSGLAAGQDVGSPLRIPGFPASVSPAPDSPGGGGVLCRNSSTAACGPPHIQGQYCLRHPSHSGQFHTC